MYLIFEFHDDGSEYILFVAPTEDDARHFIQYVQNHQKKLWSEFKAFRDAVNAEVNAYYGPLIENAPNLSLSNDRMDLILERNEKMRQMKEEYIAQIPNPIDRLILQHNVQHPDYRRIEVYQSVQVYSTNVMEACKV